MATTVVSAPLHTVHSVTALRLWHLLSLDAPSVAALWTCFFAWQFHASLSPAVPLSLALAVWLLYVVDRIVDARRGTPCEERHRFHLRHQQRFLAGVLCCLPVLLLLMVRLPQSLRVAWLLLAVPLAVYVLAVHVATWVRVPKEPLVAGFFALAAAMPAALAGHSCALLPVAALGFGWLCWLNCAAIARWERSLAKADVCTAWLARHLYAGGCMLTLPALLLLRFWHGAAVACALAGAALCLLLLDRTRDLLDPVALRALADAALLTPLAVWPLLLVFHPR